MLVYDFRVVNESAVHAAIGSIERRLARHNAFVNRTFTGTPVARPGSSTTSTSTRVGQARAAADASARAEAKAAAQAERYWRTAHQRSVDARVRADERAHRQRITQIAREEAAQKRAVASLDRQRSSALMANSRASERHARMLGRERQVIGRGLIGNASRSVGGTLGAVGTYAGAALGLAGTFAMGSAVQTQIAESAKASQIANQAGRPQIKGDLLREAQGVKGFTGMESLEALEAFQAKTGEIDTARKLMADLAELSLATGANLGDLGNTAGQAFNVLKDQIKDPVELMRQLKELMPVLAQQGRLGAVEISDLARDFGKLGAATRMFEGDAPDLLRSMGAFAQIAVARGGAEGSADASTAAMRLAPDIITNRKKFEALGIGIQSKTDKTKLRRPEEILLDLLEKTGGDVTKTSGLLGKESAKVFTGVSATFSEAEKVKKGSGRAAALAEFNRFAGAKASQAEIREQAQSRLSDTDMQLKENMKAFNAAVGMQLLPVLTRLIPEFTKLIPSIAKAAKWFADFVEAAVKNPWGTLFKVITAKLLLDLAMAGIGAAVKTKLLSLLGAARVPVPGGGAPPVPVGAAGGAGALATGAAGAAAVGSMLILGDQKSKLDQVLGERASGKLNEGLLNFIPGFKGGKFDSDQYVEELFNPIEAVTNRLKALEQIGSVLTPEGMRREQDFEAREKFLKEQNAPPVRIVEEEMRPAAEALIGAADSIKQASAVLGGTRPLNRGNTPAVPVVG